jgi:predicted dehydrogenase
MEQAITRRRFLGASCLCGLAMARPFARAQGANGDIRVGAIGLGSFVQIGGRGRKDVAEFLAIPGVRVTAICDCDEYNLRHEADALSRQGVKVKTYHDFRALLDDKEIDAVTIATPNHWHALMTIMACQAGKDVYVQKPTTHNLFEGRKMVSAARKYDRIVQATHGHRGSGAFEEAIEFAWQGNLGRIQYIYGLNYRRRESIGKVDGPQPLPATLDYHLWSGPAPMKPLMRKNLHYDWHWDWDTGHGDIGNMGIHAMDGCRWAARQMRLPNHVVSVGGRLGYVDDGQTPNTLLTYFDYDPVPILFEVRGLPRDRSAGNAMDDHLGTQCGVVIHCEGGTIRENAAYDSEGKRVRQFTRKRAGMIQNFVDAARSHKADDLYCDALEGHLSSGLLHLANTSYRLGRVAPVGEVDEALQDRPSLAAAWERMQTHLDANGIDLEKTPMTRGAALAMDPDAERYTGPLSRQANLLLSRNDREPFTIPEDL